MVVLNFPPNWLTERSLKGNHKNGINRKARTHGYVPDLEDRVGLSKDKVCITTTVDRSKNVSIDFVGFGKPNTSKLVNSYKSKIVDPNNSKVITDGDKTYISFAKSIGCQLKMLSKTNSNDHKLRKLPIIKNENGITYHIQNVNNFHSQNNGVINLKFKGVSSKYLLLYINWIKWMRQNKNDFYVMLKFLSNSLNKSKFNKITNNEIPTKGVINILSVV